MEMVMAMVLMMVLVLVLVVAVDRMGVAPSKRGYVVAVSVFVDDGTSPKKTVATDRVGSER